VIEDGDLQREATETRRAGILSSRRGWNGPTEPRRLGASDELPLRPLGPGLQIRKDSDAGANVIACDCGTVLATASENWKSGALVKESPISDGNLLIPDPARLTDDDVVMRQFACPGCLRLLDVDLSRREDPPLWDIRLKEDN